jgi:hypothetical protein
MLTSFQTQGGLNMKMYLAAAALVAAIPQPGAATTFPSLTTIYVGSGVHDGFGPANAGNASVFSCTNASGTTASIRFLVLHESGVPLKSATHSAVHGSTITVATKFTLIFVETSVLDTGNVNRGAVIIESTQSGVFCTAAVIDAGLSTPSLSMPLDLVRVNPHPGTVE